MGVTTDPEEGEDGPSLVEETFVDAKGSLDNEADDVPADDDLTQTYTSAIKPLQSALSAGFQRKRSVKAISLAVAIDAQVSSTETNQNAIQLATIPDCVGSDVGTVLVGR